MPILKDFRHIKTISVPSYPDSQITIYNSLLAKDSDDLIELQEKPSATRILEVLPKLIKEWNFTDENNALLPINSDNLNFLSDTDLLHILEKIKEFNEELKKKSETKQ
jgi:hypothetical protein